MYLMKVKCRGRKEWEGRGGGGREEGKGLRGKWVMYETNEMGERKGRKGGGERCVKRKGNRKERKWRKEKGKRRGGEERGLGIVGKRRERKEERNK